MNFLRGLFVSSLRILRRAMDRLTPRAPRRRQRFRRAGIAGNRPSYHLPLTRGNLKLHLPGPISDAQWQWLCKCGWRPARGGADRRRYRYLARKAVARLLDVTQREVAHDKIVRYDVKRRKRLGLPVDAAEFGEGKYDHHLIDTILGAEVRTTSLKD